MLIQTLVQRRFTTATESTITEPKTGENEYEGPPNTWKVTLPTLNKNDFFTI